MQAKPRTLVIDARPRGPRGPFAVEPILGRTVLERLLDIASELVPSQITVVRVESDQEDEHVTEIVSRHSLPSTLDRHGEVGNDLPLLRTVLRTNRLYDPKALRRVIECGEDPERAVIWRLDTPHGLAGAEGELVRRQTFQPLGKYWALRPARVIARTLAPTRFTPNALTMVASATFLAGTTILAFGDRGTDSRLATAFCLAAALVLDTADGHLARLQGTTSEFGKWLDGWLDEVGDMALHGAAAWSAFTQSGWSGWLVVGMIYGMGKYVFVVGNTLAEHSHQSESSTGDEVAGDRGKVSRILRWARFAGHADLRWHLWILLALIGRMELALAAYALYYPVRSTASALRKAVRNA